MVKEYRVECRNVERWGNVWVSAVSTLGSIHSGTFCDKKEAEKVMDKLIAEWKEYPIKYTNRKTIITEFRIVSRLVSEWSEDND